MKTFVLGIVLFASCLAPVAGQAVDRSVSADRALKTGVAFSVDTQSSDNGVVITFTVKNATKDKSLWMNSNPHVGHHRDRAKVSEIEITMMDRNRREVRSTCTGLRVPMKDSDFIVLKPGERFQAQYTISPDCYLVDAGETILFHAGFAHLDRRPPAPLGVWEYVGSANADDWMPIEIPRSWRKSQ